MDANGTTFSLRLGAEDWAEGLVHPDTADVVYDAERQSITLRPIVERFPTSPSASPLSAADRRGTDCDQYGNWYWIGDDRRTIRTTRTDRLASDAYWSIDDLSGSGLEDSEAGAFKPIDTESNALSAETRLYGLAVTARHFLVVGTRAPAGLLIFDLHGIGPPIWRLWPEELDVSFYEFARSFDGGAWLLDQGAETDTEARLWRLDCNLILANAQGDVDLGPAAPIDFKPVGGEVPDPQRITFPMAEPVGEGALPDILPVALPRGLADLGDGTVLLLETPPGDEPSRLIRAGRGRVIGDIVLDATVMASVLPPPARLRGHDLAFLSDANTPPGEIHGTLLIVGENGNQAFGFDFIAERDHPDLPASADIALTPRPEFLPLRSYAGRALTAHGNAAYYDLADRIVRLAARPQQQFVETGRLAGLTFAAALPGTVWHRLIFDGCVPPGGSVRIEARAADDPDDLARTLWVEQPDPYQRQDGSELPFWCPYEAPGEQRRGLGSWEFLFQSVRGRFLEVRVTLAGDGRTSPQIHALRIHHPRFSYLDRYLPDIYRDNAVSGDFLDRFLANIEGIFTAQEDRVATAEGLIDTRSTPPDYLDWLAGWLGGTLEPDWDEARRRLFIDNAELMFRWRGTVPGLTALLRLATEDCPDESMFTDLRAGTPDSDGNRAAGLRIVEAFLLRPPAGVDTAIEADDEITVTDTGTAWSVAQGASVLHQRFADFVAERRAPGLAGGAALNAIAEAWGRPSGIAALSQVRLSPTLPTNAGESEDWLAFTAGPIGFTYATVTDAERSAWQSFLQHRYRRIERLASAHQLVGAARPATFSDITLPADLPADGAALSDWIAFVSTAVPLRNAAHRFSVLVPNAPSEPLPDRRARIDHVTAIVEREKPAHTVFDVQPFWALFQVGSARLGLDTTLGSGARFTAIELGRTALSEGFIGYGHPYAVRDRMVIGRDRVGEIQL
ncbi:MAG: phage tail protein [Pseudomonadota bacterium]